MIKYTDIKIGRVEILKHKITDSDISKFVDLTGDDNKLHVSNEFAQMTEFKKPVVHGMLGASFISTIIGTKIPGDGALWFSQTLDFLLPVRVGDELTVRAEVIKKYDNENIVVLKTDILNQNQQLVTTGQAKVKVVEQKTENEEVLNAVQVEKKKTVLILGASGGIGKAAALALASAGYNLILHYFNNKINIDNLANDFSKFKTKYIALKADLTRNEDIDILVQNSLRFSNNNIDILLNSTALKIPTIGFLDSNWNDFQNQLDINLKTNYYLIKSFLPYMIENKYGKIITIGSMSTEKPNAGWSHYISAKSALNGLMKSIAFEFGPKGIRTNMISPSLVETDLTFEIPLKNKLLISSQTPLRRLANVEDIANAILFLASDNSNFINGETIRINGGQIMI